MRCVYCDIMCCIKERCDACIVISVLYKGEMRRVYCGIKCKGEIRCVSCDMTQDGRAWIQNA